ncbi:trypsin-like peptidase domain-containing protein [Streptomyces syringium]|uniref:VMAP-C domain-containing protein n=1 Tax=Streptomyces syringium TaxID=76729 RepID=UPI0034067248
MPHPENGLTALAGAATVALQPADDAALWGSGFFIAPGWVLTCAHVLAPHLRPGHGSVFHVRGSGPAGGRPTAARLEAWLLEGKPDPRAPVPPEQDLALVRLLDPMAHDCVWLSDRAAPASHRGAVSGYTRSASGTSPWVADVEFAGASGPFALRVVSGAGLPAGLSGGPVLDLGTGGVVGVVRSRRLPEGAGLAVSTAALHGFGPLAHRVLAAHDTWHASRGPRAGDGWAALQERLPGGRVVSGDQWSPADRCTALGLLADLPPPEGAGPVLQTVRTVLGEGFPRPGRLAPRSWRDGHGLLDGGDATPAVVFLHYLQLVAHCARQTEPDSPAARRLADWIDVRLTRVAPFLRPLVVHAALPSSLLSRREEPREAVPFPVAGDGYPVVTVELEPLFYARPSRFYWRVRLDDGHGEYRTLAEEHVGAGVRADELVPRLAGPLAQAFHFADLPGQPAPLEVALPAEHFDTGVHRWSTQDTGPLRPLGEHRSVVLRDLDRRDGLTVRVRERWTALHRAETLTALRTSPPGRSAGVPLERSGPGTVPVICRPVGGGEGRRMLGEALDAGFGVALWCTGGHPGTDCTDFCDTMVRGAGALLEQSRTARELPDRLRQLRHRIGATREEGHWAETVALLWDDPTRPLPADDITPLDSP